MCDMPRPRPPHLHREKTRHGKFVWYVRVGKGPRRRLRSEFGTSEFTLEYEGHVSGRPLIKRKAALGTLAWLYERYRDSAAWRELSMATRRQRENIIGNVMKTAGGDAIGSVTPRAVVAGRDRRKDTPAQARNFLDAMRGMFRWALDAGLIGADPTAGIKNPKRKKGQGFVKWTEVDVERYEARWPVGTRQRVWLDVLLYTGLRRGDAVRIGPQHCRDNVATMRLEKGGETVTVNLPILPALQTTLAAGPCADLAFICGERGHRLTKESFGNMFKEACVAAGVNLPKKAAHGLRKIGATRAADNGATVAELEAIFGWQGGGMAAHYTREADRKRLARGAMAKLQKNDEATSIPAPANEVRAISPKVS